MRPEDANGDDVAAERTQPPGWTPTPTPTPAKRPGRVGLVVAISTAAVFGAAAIALGAVASQQHGKAEDAREATADLRKQHGKTKDDLDEAKTTIADQSNQIGTCAYVNEILDYYWLIQQEIMDASTASDDGEYNAAIEGWTKARDYQVKANDLQTEAGYDGDLQGLQDECGYLDDLGDGA